MKKSTTIQAELKRQQRIPFTSILCMLSLSFLERLKRQYLHDVILLPGTIKAKTVQQAVVALAVVMHCH